MFSLVNLNIPAFSWVIFGLLVLFYVLGAFWSHKKGLYLFPRYFIKWKENNGKYELNANEKAVVACFGRKIMMWCLGFMFAIIVLLTVYRLLKINYGLVALIVISFLYLYHYYASFSTGGEVE